MPERVLRVLIVEDDVSLCMGISDMLNEFGFDTAVAADGIKALNELANADPLPDFILLDLHMPNMDGWQLRDTLKNDTRYCDIPVIVMSGDQSLTSVEADGHLMKPLDMYAILAYLQ